MEQTAVQWLVEELKKNGYLGVYCTKEEESFHDNNLESIISTAISMEAGANNS
jgi:hypothetical protein